MNPLWECFECHATWRKIKSQRCPECDSPRIFRYGDYER